MSGQQDKVNDDVELKEDERRKARQEEWGHQFDIWLIRAAKNGRLIELFLSDSYPGVTQDSNIISCIPLRVDKYYIQVSINDEEIWINKSFVIGCKGLGSKTKVENDSDDTSPASEEEMGVNKVVSSSKSK